MKTKTKLKFVQVNRLHPHYKTHSDVVDGVLQSALPQAPYWRFLPHFSRFLLKVGMGALTLIDGPTFTLSLRPE